MIVSHKHKFVFIHIPKCAGTSIKRSLIPCLAEDDIVHAHDLQHLTAAKIRQKYMHSKKDWRQYFRFAFFRNPWDRLYSHYCYRTATARMLQGQFDMSQPWQRYLSEYDIHQNFNDFVMRMYRASPSRSLIRRFCFIKGRQSVSFIGQFENIHNDWRRVCFHIGLPEIPLLHKNQKTYGRPDYRTAYSKKLRRLVRKMFSFDVEYFGYTFD